MNVLLILIIPILFLIVGLIGYYKRKNTSDIEYQEEMKRLRNTHDNLGGWKGGSWNGSSWNGGRWNGGRWNGEL